jgi:hypothetical protein
VAISVISALVTESSNWEIQVIAGAALGFESDTLAISSSEISLGAGGRSFTVAAGKFLPETASVLARDLANPGNYLYGTITAYTAAFDGSATLVVDVRNVFGSGSSSAWAIRLLDGPGVIDDTLPEDWGLISQTAPEDYRFITTTHAMSEDYDLVSAGITTSIDYGAV